MREVIGTIPPVDELRLNTLVPPIGKGRETAYDRAEKTRIALKALATEMAAAREGAANG